jgi:isopentenyl-diphosphate delta-isomerase type 1
MTDEWFDLLDSVDRRVIGRARRPVCHRHPGLLHGVVHVLVFDHTGRLLLQQRSATKDIQPGKWDTSVGGHRLPGEAPETAAARELREELGVDAPPLHPAYAYRWQSDREAEWIDAFATVHDGPFDPDPSEIDAVRFWPLDELRTALTDGPFTPQLVLEFPRIETFAHTHLAALTGAAS